MENAYIYTRVSTLIQVDGFSLEAQEAEIRAFAEARKINIVGKYTDEGKPGKNAEHRPAFTQMMEDIRSKKDNIRYVLVFKLSRFARNTSDTAKYLQELSSYGIGLWGIKDGIDTSTVNGRLAIVHSGQGALMANLNSENPHVGRKFQEFVKRFSKKNIIHILSKKQQSPSADRQRNTSLILPMLTGLSWLNANVIRGLIPGMFRAQS